MKKSMIYAAACTLCLVGACVCVFCFAWDAGVDAIIETLVGFVVSLLLAPLVHECGHVVLAKIENMQWVYVKFFCIECKKEGKKTRVKLVSPFAPDETQAVPKTGGNMPRRAIRYTLGGLIFGGCWCVLLVAGVAICAVLGKAQYGLLGGLPYSAYLFLLNAAPLEYPSGKTDGRIALGLKKGCDAEKAMLSAMEIQGNLFAGNSYAEIDEALYLSSPQLCEDEPLFAVLLDLKYRYYLEKNNLVAAADCLNRLAGAQVYLPDFEVEKIAAELAYMHALRGDKDGMDACSQSCGAFLQTQSLTARRILAACAAFAGKTEEAELLKESAKQYEENELLQGVVKSERILLARIASV